MGTSILVTRYVSKYNQSLLYNWMESGSQAVLKKIILDAKERENLGNELIQLDFETKIKDWALEKNITNLIEFKDETVKNWVGSRTKVPFARNQLQTVDDVGFYKDVDTLNFNYLLKANEREFFATQKIDPLNVALYFEVYGTAITIVESEGENTGLTLYTTLPKTLADELLQKTSFEKNQTSPEHISLAKDTHVVQMFDLISHPPIRQKILFTKRISSYQIVSSNDILIFIWTFFCISIVLNVVLFKFSDR